MDAQPPVPVQAQVHPPLRWRTLARRSRSGGVFSVLERADCEVAFYGKGKPALTDALALLDPPDDANILLPAYVPDGVAAAIRATGVEPRFHRIEANLSPDLADLRARRDDATVAVMAVHYFGVPQPGLDDLRAFCDRHDLWLVGDNAHSPLSRRGSQLLGTVADVGFTSLHKQFPVPNGAVLTLADATLVDRRDALSENGVMDWYSRDDLGFCVSQTLRRVRAMGADRVFDAVRTLRSDSPDASGAPTERDPVARYNASRQPLSRLTRRHVARVDTSRVVRERRHNYGFLANAVADTPGVTPLYPSIDPGVCPQVFPVVADDPESLLSRLGGAGGSTWPPLPAAVQQSSAFDTTTHLADQVVRLPVHQGLSRDALAVVGRAVQSG